MCNKTRCQISITFQPFILHSILILGLDLKVLILPCWQGSVFWCWKTPEKRIWRIYQCKKFSVLGKVFVKTQCFAKSGILELDLHQFMQFCVQTRLILDNHRHKCTRGISKVWYHLLYLPKFWRFMLFSWGQIWFDRLGPFKTFDFMKLCLKPGIRSLWSNKMNIRHKLDKIQISWTCS